jgi:glyoxylase-like metal-dependent hydrolase (beta-lactamase superfamily II)
MKLSVVALSLAAACSASSPSPQAPAAKSGRAERLEIGDLEAYALEDGHLVVPNDGKVLGFGRPPSETAEVLAAAGLPRDTIDLDIQCLLVKAGDRVILFDTGMGEASLPAAGHLPRSLALAGVPPGAITDIFISHAHSDHVGGLVTRAGALGFPAATIHLSAPEWAALRADTDKEATRLVAAIAPKVSPFEPGAQVLPIVKAVATHGHTPGHSSYLIAAGTDTLFYLGDLAHHSVISVQRPAWSIQVDADRPAAEAMRQQTLASLATDHTRVFAVHFPFPGVGHIVADGPGLVWKPEPPHRGRRGAPASMGDDRRDLGNTMMRAALFCAKFAREYRDAIL